MKNWNKILFTIHYSPLTRKAFTLAEVLITLGIIGVVAAMTIPTLVNNTNDAEMKTALKKIFSDISNATKQMQYDEGGIPWSATATQKNTETDSMFNEYAKYLKFIQTEDLATCGAYTGQIFAPQYNQYKSNSKLIVNYNFYHCYGKVGSLSNGMSILFLSLPLGTSATINNKLIYGEIRADINGPKPPNSFGKDFFVMLVLQNPDGSLIVVPAGMQGTYNTSGHYFNCASWGTDNYAFKSAGCTYYALNDLPMP